MCVTPLVLLSAAYCSGSVLAMKVAGSVVCVNVWSFCEFILGAFSFYIRLLLLNYLTVCLAPFCE